MVLDRLDVLIQEILNGKNIPETNRELREQLARDLKERLLNRINRSVIEAVPQEKLAELDELMGVPDTSEQQIRALILSSGIDLKHITLETMRQFKAEYLGADNGAVA